jgi:hypothetical protein
MHLSSAFLPGSRSAGEKTSGRVDQRVFIEEEIMEHRTRYFISGFIILAIGLALGAGLFSGRVAVVSADQGPLVDGQPQQPTPTGSIRDQADPQPAPMGAAAHYYMSYAANEFHSTHSDLTYASFGAAIYALNIPGGGFSFKLPVSLPNGSQVLSITTYVVDNSASNMSIQLYRVTLATAAQGELASVTTAALTNSTAVQSVTMSGAPIAVIDTTNYAYSIRYAPVITGSAHEMVGVKIEFIPPPGYLYLPFAHQ